MDQDELEQKLQDAHEKEGSKRFGKRWATANIGWGQDDLSIATKVYGDEPVIFCSEIDEDGTVTHTEEPYRR